MARQKGTTKMKRNFGILATVTEIATQELNFIVTVDAVPIQ